MHASILDLRYKMKDVLKALNRNENVTILYHGKPKGVIIPHTKKHIEKIEQHDFFGMLADDNQTVAKQMQRLRGNRYDDL